MNEQAMVDEALRRLEAMNHPALRGDYRRAVELAQQCIVELASDESAEERRLRFVAQRIAKSASLRPVMVYRAKRNRAIKWRAAISRSGEKVGPHRVIGYYDDGAGWQDILEDLRQ